MMVLGLMMVPHHHHESLAKIKRTHHENVSHAHHHGSHHHDHENHDSEGKESNDQNVPQHFHFSTSDNFEPLRIDQVARGIAGQSQPTLTIINLFSWNPDDSYDCLNYPNIWPGKTAKSQNNPGANGLRAPPSIA